MNTTYTRDQIEDQGITACTYGSQYTQDTCHYIHMDDGTTIYAVDDSVNVNQCCTDEFTAQDEADTLHVENLSDFDTCTAGDPITDSDDLAELICEEEETEEDEMNKILDSITNGQHKQATHQWNECNANHCTTPAELYDHANETHGAEIARKTLDLFTF